MPSDERADEIFGWGLSGLAWFFTVASAMEAVTLILGVLGVLGPKAPGLEMLPGLVIAILLGPVLLRYDLRRRRARTSLVRVSEALVLCRGGAPVGALSGQQIRRLRMNVVGTWAYAVLAVAVCVASIWASFSMESARGRILLLACLVPPYVLLASPIWLRLTCEFLAFPGDASPRRAFRKRDLERLFSSQRRR